MLVKGGHDEGEALADALVEDDNITSWQGQRIDTRDTHGTGCTMASAIAVLLAQGRTLPQAVDRAREFVRLALRGAPGLGQGRGPLGQGSVRLDLGGAMRLNQVAVGLDDYEASRDFYRELGLTLIVDSAPDYARFECGGGATFSIHRVEMSPGSLSPLATGESPSPDGRGDTTVYFECDDLDAEVERLARAGVRFEHGPANQSWLWREARLLDPFGNMVCLYKAGEARRFPPWRVG